MAKKESVVWIWRGAMGNYYEIGMSKPSWSKDYKRWVGHVDKWFCKEQFQQMFPFFELNKRSLGKITNTMDTLTFEIVE